MRNKSIALIMPSLPSGGAEKVMSILANEFVSMNIEVHLILFLENIVFFDIDERVIIHYPKYKKKNKMRIIYSFNSILFLRRKLIEIKPTASLTFGGRYNSFSIISALGLNINSFISDRSQPGISYGFLQDIINSYCYKFAKGIICQTIRSKELTTVKTKHKNIEIIANPIQSISNNNKSKEKIIINVGRFVKDKNQEELIQIFNSININDDWKLFFIGDGPTLNQCKELVKNIKREDSILFKGQLTDVISELQNAAIFAFTSKSEGFPNALAEALSCGCACISYNCVAGPSDLITNDDNGYLIPLNDINNYKLKLEELMKDEGKRNYYGNQGVSSVMKLNKNHVVNHYLNFIFG